MDPILIDADDQQRARPGSLRSPYFRRMVALTWPHRRLIAIGILASVFYGAFQSISIIGMLPVLRVLMSDEGLHGWVQRTAAEDRLGVTIVPEFEYGPEGPRLRQARVQKVSGWSPLHEHGAVFDIQRAGGVDASDPQFLTTIASADDSVDLEFRTAPTTAGGPFIEHTVAAPLRPVSTKNRLLALLARAVPMETARTDRVTSLIYVLSTVVVLVIISNGARFVSQYFVATGVLRAVMDLRRTLYRKVLRLPMDFFSTNTADLVSRFVQDAQEVQRGLMSLFGKLIREPIKAVFILAMALWINAQLTVTMLIIAPVTVLIFWAIGRKIRKANKRLLQTYGLMIGALGTTLHAIGLVKAYNAENIERQRLWRIDRRMFKHQLRIAKLEAFLNPLLEVLGIVAIASVTVWLGAQVVRGDVAIEDFAGVLIALAMLLDPLRKFADVYPRVMRSAAGANRIFSVVDAPAEAELLEGAVDLPPLADRIEFKDVTFSYNGAAAAALDRVNLTIKKGETVAIVGPNGSGKTTLTRLLVRFYDPQTGKVFFDGVDIHNATLRSLRRQIAMVTQDPVVFDMTIAENIAYGDRKAHQDRIVSAARQAHAAEFIEARPGGYDEKIGERGVTLSGGQRQRICIARAIMRDAPILIFDEATSQVDSESELRIQDAIRSFAQGQGRTTIIIAHRLSTIRFASRVVVMDAGRIIDIGTHDELMKRCELYAALCRTQLVQ